MEDQAKMVEIEELVIEELVSKAGAGRPVVLTRGGDPVAAVVAIETLRSLIDERELLRRLALGELESAAGEGDELAAVIEDCRLLLEDN